MMAGQLHKQKAIDRIHGAYRDECKEFAESFGYDENYLATWFEQFCFMRIHEQGMEFNLAAWLAMRDVRACFYKPGEMFN